MFVGETALGFTAFSESVSSKVTALPMIGWAMARVSAALQGDVLTLSKGGLYLLSLAGLIAAVGVGGEQDRFVRWLAVPLCRAVLALVLVFLLGVVFSADGAFGILGTHRDALRQASVFGMLACGMTLVIISGGIDLAVGSVLALVAVTFSLMSIHWGWSPWLSVPLCLVLGAVCGGVAGTATAWFRVQPFIATLAMMVFARGLAKTVSGGMKVSSAVKNADGTFRYVDVPAVFRFIDSRILHGNLSVVTVIFIV